VVTLGGWRLFGIGRPKSYPRTLPLPLAPDPASYRGRPLWRLELVSIDSTLADLVAVETVTYDEALKDADNPTYLSDLLNVRAASR
jgi:hypothetical protein